jgi:hypothetical protein
MFSGGETRVMTQSPSVHSLLVESIDDLRMPISNADIEITSLGGRVQGHLTRVSPEGDYHG